MIVFTEQMKKMLKSGKCILATASLEGVPNIGPKGSFTVLDDSTLAYGELTGKQCLSHIKENPKVAVAVVDHENLAGFRFLGKAKLETEGKLYETFAQKFAEMKMPKPVAAVVIEVEKIFDLSATNPGEVIMQKS